MLDWDLRNDLTMFVKYIFDSASANQEVYVGVELKDQNEKQEGTLPYWEQVLKRSEQLLRRQGTQRGDASCL